MASPFVQCRVTREVREQVERAADECGMPVGSWLREVVIGALELHFGVEVPSESDPEVVYRVTGESCTCPGFVHNGHCKHFDALHAPRVEESAPAPSTAGDDDLVSLDEDDRAVLDELRSFHRERVQHPGDPEPAQRKQTRRPNCRDCVHPPPWPAGRCRLCNLRIGHPGSMAR